MGPARDNPQETLASPTPTPAAPEVARAQGDLPPRLHKPCVTAFAHPVRHDVHPQDVKTHHRPHQCVPGLVVSDAANQILRPG